MMHPGKLIAAFAVMILLSPVFTGHSRAAAPEGSVAIKAPMIQAAERRRAAARATTRAGEYQVAGKKKGLKTLGIIAGVAATAIIINEAAKAKKREKARRKAAKRRARARRNNCHSGLRRHRHSALGGRYQHRHDGDCDPYRPNSQQDTVVQPTCGAGYEFVDGQCYRNEELDDGPGPGQQAGNSGDAYARCAERFVSFRYSDGTYQPFGNGGRLLCPYISE